MEDKDLKLTIAIITASASVIAATLTYLYKLITDQLEKRKVRKTHLMAIRNELVVNGIIANTIFKETRTLGFRFLDKTWNTVDTSVIYHRGIPYNDILEIYSYIQVFNLLNDRSILIRKEPDYRNKSDQLALEHTEMIELNEKIKSRIESVLISIKVA